MAGEQFVFVVLCSRNKIFFPPRSHLAACPFPNTHPFSAVGFSELWENKEVLPALPLSWSGRLTHPYHAGQEAQSTREVHRPGRAWGEGALRMRHLRMLPMSPAPQQQVQIE